MNFLCVHPSLKGRLGGPNRADSKLGLRKVGVVRRQKKMTSQKGPKKVTKIDASFARNLGTELDLPNAVTLLKGQGKLMFVF